MKTSIGSPARKEQFFKRIDIRKSIVDSILSGENLLLSAPRRVGKTSILYDLLDNPEENIYTIYLNTEAVEDNEKFFQRIINEILDSDKIENYGKFGKKTKDFLNTWAKKIASVNIGGFGLELNQTESPSYYDQLVELLSGLNLEGNKLVVLLDEFPITVEHIHRKHGLETVKIFLDQNRSIRQHPEL
jgi:uncharacterized protein